MERKKILQWKTEVFCSLVSILIYSNTFQADFVYDDHRAIVHNPDVTKRSPLSSLLFNDFWGTPLNHSGSHGSYRPLTVLSFRLNFLVFGLQPSAYHVTNVLLHSATTFLFCHALISLLQLSHAKALVAGLLFAVHPVHTEAVAGIVGRADILATLFCLATLLSYEKACELADGTLRNSNKQKANFKREKSSKVSQQVKTVFHKRVPKANKKVKVKHKKTKPNSKAPQITDRYRKNRDYDAKEQLSMHNKDIHLENFNDKVFDRLYVDRDQESGSMSDDSHITTDTYDSVTSTGSSLNELCGEDQYSEKKSLQNSNKESHCLRDESTRHCDNAFTFFSVTSSKIFSQEEKQLPNSNTSNGENRSRSSDSSNHQTKPCTICLWYSFSFFFAFCSLLSKESGYCALPMCLVYDLFIRHRMGVTRSISLLFAKKPGFEGIRRRLLAVLLVTAVLLSFRVGLPAFMTRETFTLPKFSPSDNPAAASDDFITRALTFNYLLFCNLQLLVFPTTLNFDWSMDSIPLVTSVLDPRNIMTLLVYLLFFTCLRLIFVCLRKRDAKSLSRHSPLHEDLLFFPSYKSKSHRCSISSEESWNGDSANDLNNNDAFQTKPKKNRKPLRGWSAKSGLSEINFGMKSDVESSSLEDVAILGVSVIAFGLLPASNLLFYVGFVLAERVLYLSSMGSCLLLTELGFLLSNFFVKKVWHGDARMTDAHLHHTKTPFKKKNCRSQLANMPNVGRVLATWSWIGIVLILLCSKTMTRNEDWKNEESLYSSGTSINSAKSLGNLANVLRSQGKFDEAETAYLSALKHRPNMADMHYNLGLLYQHSNRLKMAEESYKRAIHFRPKLASAHLNLGVILAEQGKTEEAKMIYRRTADLDFRETKDPRTHAHAQISALYNLGNLLAEEEAHEKAIAVFYEAVERPLDQYKPHSLYNMLGQSLFHMDKLEESERWYKASLDSKPDHIPTFLTYARLLTQKGRLNEAESLYLQALSLESDKKTVYKHIGNFYTSTGKFAKAGKILSEALEENIGSDDYELIFSAASAYRQSKKYAKAEIYYTKATLAFPKLAAAHMNLGAILHLQGKYLLARKSYLKALELEGDKELILENLSKLERVSKKE